MCVMNIMEQSAHVLSNTEKHQFSYFEYRMSNLFDSAIDSYEGSFIIFSNSYTETKSLL